MTPEFDPIIVPFRDMPYRHLTQEEYIATVEVGTKAETLALRLLGDKINANIFLPGRDVKIELMGSAVNEVTGYRGAGVVVERWQLRKDGGGKARDFSYAFYPDLILNRPNFICWWIGEEKDEFTNPDDHPVFGKEPESYEVGKEELEELIKVLEAAEKQGEIKDGFFQS